jgi:uncharacterized membrane protein
MTDPLKESVLRSLLKALSWRVVGLCSTILIAWIVFRDIKPALAIGGIEFFAKFFVYYGHERLWQMVPRGTIRKVLSHDRQPARADKN